MGRDRKEACCVASSISGLLGPSYTWALDCSKASVKTGEVKYTSVGHRDRSGGSKTNQGRVGRWLQETIL